MTEYRLDRELNELGKKDSEIIRKILGTKVLNGQCRQRSQEGIFNQIQKITEIYDKRVIFYGRHKRI